MTAFRPAIFAIHLLRAATALLCGAAMQAARLPAQETVRPAAEEVEGTIVHYLSETPFRWEGAAGNPLENMAQSLGALWGQKDTEITSERLENIKRQITWEGLKDAAVNGHAFRSGSARMLRQRQVFVIHGYEYCHARTAAKFEPLLVAAREGKPAMAEFVLLCRTGEHASEGRKFHYSSLRDKEIFVAQSNCGNLVYRWLDMQTRPDTGFGAAQSAAIRTAGTAAEAVLAVAKRKPASSPAKTTKQSPARIL
jgi:hypothetical protein